MTEIYSFNIKFLLNILKPTIPVLEIFNFPQLLNFITCPICTKIFIIILWFRHPVAYVVCFYAYSHLVIISKILLLLPYVYV